MIPLGSLSPVAAGVVASAAGSVATGSAERSAKLDSAAHSLAAGRRELSLHPLDRDPDTSADRDADGWTGNSDGGAPGEPAPQESADPLPPATRSRLPDDPCGGRLDVTA